MLKAKKPFIERAAKLLVAKPLVACKAKKKQMVWLFAQVKKRTT